MIRVMMMDREYGSGVAAIAKKVAMEAPERTVTGARTRVAQAEAVHYAEMRPQLASPGDG